jgi:hypothetical protein
MKKKYLIFIFIVAISNIYSQEKLFTSNNTHLYLVNSEYELYYETGGYNKEIKHYSPMVYELYSKGKYKTHGKHLICTDSVTHRKYYFRYLNQCHLKGISKNSHIKGLIFVLSTYPRGYVH